MGAVEQAAKAAQRAREADSEMRRAVAAAYDGHNAEAIAAATGLSVATVYRIVRKAKQQT